MFRLLKLINIHSNLVITLHDIKTHMAPKDPNKSVKDNQTYLWMNSKTQACMTFVNQMDDELTNNFDDLVQSLYSKIASWTFFSPSIVLHLFV